MLREGLGQREGDVETLVDPFDAPPDDPFEGGESQTRTPPPRRPARGQPHRAGSIGDADGHAMGDAHGVASGEGHAHVLGEAHALEGQCAVLVRRIVQHDATALDALYRHTAGRVYAMALHLTHAPALAEEVLETVFWQVWRDAPRFDAARGGVMAWLLVMARSRAFDALRRERRHGPPADPCAVDLVPDEALPPDRLMELVQRDVRLHSALAVLPPLQRQLIELAFFSEATHEAIATQMNMPLGTIKSHIRRTLLQLRQLMMVTP